MSDEPTFASTVTDPLYEQVFVLEQHELYGALAGVLVAETQQVLDSAMTREQIASALVSVMARVAQGEDLLAPSAGVVPLHLSGRLPLSVRRGQ